MYLVSKLGSPTFNNKQKIWAWAKTANFVTIIVNKIANNLYHIAETA